MNIKVTTKASKNEIREVRNDELLISVTAAPENNKANEAIINVLSKKLKIPKSNISILSGDKSRNKKISIISEKDITKTLSDFTLSKN
ncbi:MAG: DUF167 domain-containing protein [Alphaproteobacteria bacterium]|nr:DUF167 domain-containing protein [Alphaproteobacteria bacterium]